ncbi:MAG: hypothetical protein HRT64_08930 [Erythrobacter sp.]|nr:hypothetical protein [Erythrobacter sp.]
MGKWFWLIWALAAFAFAAFTAHEGRPVFTILWVLNGVLGFMNCLLAGLEGRSK